MQLPCLHLCKTSFTANHRLGFHNNTLKTMSLTKSFSPCSNFQKLNYKRLTTHCQSKPSQRQNSSPGNGVKVKGKKENIWSVDNDMAKTAAEKEKGRSKQRRRRGRRVVRGKRNRGGRIMVSGAMLMEVESLLQTQEPVIRPAWNTFASSVSGIWKGVGAIFSPITGEMEPIELEAEMKIYMTPTLFLALNHKSKGR